MKTAIELLDEAIRLLRHIGTHSHKTPKLIELMAWQQAVGEFKKLEHETASKLSPLIRTERFEIFKATCLRTQNGCDPRDVYLAFFHSQDVPRPVCTLTIWDGPLGRYIEWVEVPDGFRRQGIATEVLKAFEDQIGSTVVDGVTESGVAFVDAYNRRFPIELETEDDD